MYPTLDKDVLRCIVLVPTVIYLPELPLVSTLAPLLPYELTRINCHMYMITSHLYVTILLLSLLMTISLLLPFVRNFHRYLL